MEENGAPHSGPSSSREVFLAILICAFVAAPFVFLFSLLAAGILVYMIPLLLLAGALACMHYFLWGRALDREVTEEREEWKIVEGIEDDGWPSPEPWNGRRF